MFTGEGISNLPETGKEPQFLLELERCCRYKGVPDTELFQVADSTIAHADVRTAHWCSKLNISYKVFHLRLQTNVL